MQAKALALLFMQRDELTCTRASSDEVNIICSHPALKSEDSGCSRLDRSEFTIGIRYVKVCIGLTGDYRALCLSNVVKADRRLTLEPSTCCRGCLRTRTFSD